jgi:hypothetical protein
VNRIFNIFLIPLAGVFLLCSLNSLSTSGGGGIETVALCGKIVDTLGRPASLAQVVLVSATYNPVTGGSFSRTQTDTTDAEGNYRLLVSDSGLFNIFAARNLDGTRLLIRNIRVGKDSVFVPVDTLRKPGTITVVLPNGIDTTNGYLYITGTTKYSFLRNTNGSVVLDSIPAMVSLSIYYAVRGSSAQPQLVRDSVIVTPGGMMNIAYVEWKYSKKIILNTTASGANIAGNVMDFPVLVRLTSGNFNFAQAKSGGEDVRFTKSDGTPLSYEIERWNASLQAAEVWVRVDTVFGNNGSQFIAMYWGDSNAVGESNSAAVFDTVDGNLGVWHLGSNLNDATINGDNGVDSSTGDASGIIGRCRQFDPAKRSFITIPNESRFDMTANFTLSAWVYVESFTDTFPAIIAKGDDTYRLHLAAVDSQYFPCFSTDIRTDLGSALPISYRSWHLVCGVYDSTTMRLYIDGVFDRELVRSQPCSVNDSNVTIGDNRAMLRRFFYGTIDEVRIMHSAMNADWVKLCFTNQKSQDALVEFK